MKNDEAFIGSITTMCSVIIITLLLGYIIFVAAPTISHDITAPQNIETIVVKEIYIYSPPGLFGGEPVCYIQSESGDIYSYSTHIKPFPAKGARLNVTYYINTKGERVVVASGKIPVEDGGI